ncbi:MAG: hypothetical protein AMK72_13065 [Planctomycetes bacterium SM23_25]|nr:MAG: hypothetical protein AMK72_13065 [Planctomycetes bacterium SM23_25]
MESDRASLTRRDFLRALAAGAVAASLPARALAKTATERPNFVVIFTDDQGYQDVGCFGAPKIKTPHLDRMAAEGMKFTDFYVAASVCSPSRAALLTGCYPTRTGVTRVLFPRDNTGLKPGMKTIAEVLKTRGYATACIGKWHLGHTPPHLPTFHGFDYYFGIPYSNDMRPTPVMRNTETVEEPANQATLTQRYTEEAVKFVRANRDKPFFLYLPHTMPHVPLFVSETFKDKSAGGLYGDVIEEIDWSTGEILKTLKGLGLDSKTLVVYTSDNGPWLSKKAHGGCALPLRDGKFSTYEGGFREPCIMRWPGTIPAAAVCSETALTMDLLPTFAKLAGADLPAGYALNGKDISALMTRPGAKTPHDAFFYYRGTTLDAVRSGQWKAILYAKGADGRPGKPHELYDLKADIGEATDVASANPDVVARLAALAEAGVKANGGNFGRGVPKKKPAKKTPTKAAAT